MSASATQGGHNYDGAHGSKFDFEPDSCQKQLSSLLQADLAAASRRAAYRHDT